MAKDWISSDLLKKARQTAEIYAKAPAYGFGWWFWYFWKERSANTRDLAASEALMKDVLAVVFESEFSAAEASENAAFSVKRAAGNRVAAAFRPPLPEPADLSTHPQKYRRLLLDVMAIGFREMPARPLVTMSEHEAREMFSDLVEVDMGGYRQPVALAYRGEGRDFDAIVRNRGATPRAQLGSTVRMNMEAPWHPFSDPQVASRAYARGTSGDNCLYTVNSVAPSLALPVGFPLIEDENIYALPRPKADGERDLSSWNYAMLRGARSPAPGPQGEHRPIILVKCRIGGVPGKPAGIFMATENWVYAIRLTSAMHTQAFVEGNFSVQEGQCVERGVGVVTLPQYVAGVRVRRIHHGAARACGVTGFVQERRFQLGGHWHDAVIPEDLAAAHFHGDRTAALDTLRILGQHFGDGAAPHRILGEADPVMADRARIEVQSIEQWDLTIEQLNAHKARLGDRLYFAPFVLPEHRAAAH